MPLPDGLLLPPPRQPTPEVRAGRAYRDFSGIFIALLTVAIVLFVIPLAFLPRLQVEFWIAASLVIVATAPLRAWGLRRGLLSYFVHGIAKEGRVVAVAPAGERTWRVRYRYDGGGAGEVEAEALVYDAEAAPLGVGQGIAVLHRAGDPRDSVLPELSGILAPPDAQVPPATAVPGERG